MPTSNPRSLELLIGKLPRPKKIAYRKVHSLKTMTSRMRRLNSSLKVSRYAHTLCGQRTRRTTACRSSIATINTIISISWESAKSSDAEAIPGKRMHAFSQEKVT